MLIFAGECCKLDGDVNKPLLEGILPPAVLITPIGVETSEAEYFKCSIFIGGTIFLWWRVILLSYFLLLGLLSSYSLS